MMIEDVTTQVIIGCAMKVHRILGCGFQEVIYQRALAIELATEGVSFEREKEMVIHYGNRQIGNRRVDFFVGGKIMVELKALVELAPKHMAQAKNYLEAYKVDVGLLINFGTTSLEFKRIYRRRACKG